MRPIRDMKKPLRRSKNDDLKNKLLEIMIKCASFNPSNTLGQTQGEYPTEYIARKKSEQSNEKTMLSNVESMFRKVSL